MASFLDHAFEASTALLGEQLAAELERQRREAVEEPDVPRPRPDGVLADLRPGS